MDGANADSDHSMTWEDFFGSTTDLAPTLIGIYDSFLDPVKSGRTETSRFDLSPKDARTDPPRESISTEYNTQQTRPEGMDKCINSRESDEKMIEKAETWSPSKDPSKIAGGVKLPGLTSINKSSLYNLRSKLMSDVDGAEDVKCSLNSSDSVTSAYKSQVRTFKDKSSDVTNAFDNLSPNVKRMISSATETTKSNTLKYQKKTTNIVRSSIRGHKLSNIPLVGATSKISQSGVEILPSVEIYDQPCGFKAARQASTEILNVIPPKTVQNKPDFLVNEETTYDVPTNNKLAIYDVPNNNKTAFESLSLPYIDQSIELSISSNDREFDIKLHSKENSPDKPNTKISTQEGTPSKIPKNVSDGTNSLHRKDFSTKSENPILISNPYPDTIGSTGNLKLCDKERLNPPTVEVSRPLSMSSIASSSSTSSSGVQNKGGVNSAYLASIESLDDHSDADFTSAKGSNNFVNDAGVLNNSVSDEKNSEGIREYNSDLPGLTQLERVCAEIVQTENVYVEDLRQVVEGYLQVWRQDVQLSQEELSELFNNIEDIYAFNKSLCAELNTCRLDAACIARCFVLHTDGFGVYTSYCTGYPCTMERLAALAAGSRSAKLLRDRQLALEHRLPLASYLLKPVQRILKYHLLLQKVVKLKACRDTEAALCQMTAIAHHIDDMKRRHEHAVRVQEIQSLLYGWNGPDLTTYGELCAEGTFRVFGAKAMRHAFLFDKMLLITKNREDGILAYKSHIMCNNMMLVECIAGAPLSFHVIPWDAPRAQLTLQARSQRHKREWTLLLKRVILENYNAVIPSHARQLVMELGQNRTDDDIIAEKSHNLITQASMRKQLSAPEYLEKRKLERDRRKSFDTGPRDRPKKINRKHTIATPTTANYRKSCDCVQYSAEKGTDYTCENCYIDLCSDCDAELSRKEKRDEECSCRTEHLDITADRCPECDRSLHYIDSGSAEHLERKQSCCKCSDFKSSQESVGKEFSGALNKIRGYHSTDNIVGYTESNKSKEDLSDTNNSCTNVRTVHKTCLKCEKIKENIAVTDSTSTIHSRKSRCSEVEKLRTERSKSKDDSQRSKLSKIGTWRRKSEPGLQQNSFIPKRSESAENERGEMKGLEKIEFECRSCGSNKINRKSKDTDMIISDSELDIRRETSNTKPNFEIKMYNTKNIPKKISKLKKNRAKGFRFGSDTTAKFYADLSTDVSTENILHISESNDSINVIDRTKKESTSSNDRVPGLICKDEDIDEETYKKLIEKTDSFKKNELEKVKYLNQQKVINEGSEVEGEKQCDIEKRHPDEQANESCDEIEQPIEQIISQLLMQNREFQKLLKKQQLRNTAQRRHQRLLKSYSNPDQIITRNRDQITGKPKFDRQVSENLGITRENEENIKIPSYQHVDDSCDDDHIYETLRVETIPQKTKEQNEESSGNTRVSNSGIPITSSCGSPPSKFHSEIRHKIKNVESDYVYLTFDKFNKSQETEIDVIYDVPVKSHDTTNNIPYQTNTDYYVTVENQTVSPQIEETRTVENLYDNVVEVRKGQKETVATTPGEYLAMGPDQSPNAPEIWLSRQKEHFITSRDRKSGSLPRSFQIVTASQDENNLSTFKCKPNSNSKTYLNRDGKVVSMDRPFTIASDKSEISYEDVENYMGDDDILKFNKNCSSLRNSQECDYAQNISQSTLELEEEIDRCYKSNFESISLDQNKNNNLVASQPNLNNSITSSCEMLSSEINIENQGKEPNVIHPEHKIYKPTSNMLSLKNVLNRFKNKSSNKNSIEDNTEVNSNDNTETNTELKISPANEKRSTLNPRNYSKNLFQRFRSIISDDNSDDNQNRSDIDAKNEIKVVITSSDVTPAVSTIYTLNSDILSRSVCENTTLTESQSEKNNLELLSNSCNNITQKPEPMFKPAFEKSTSMITNSTPSSMSSPSKSNNNSYQNLNKLPIYMQGSKNLGARIAQSDYIDPTTLLSDNKSILSNINVLINKNAVRPDSLFSNSSFVTSSSEGTYHNDGTTKTVANTNEVYSKERSSIFVNSDESYFEKSFERIEQILDEDVFRDSAVYSDQEEGSDIKIDLEDDKIKIISRVDNINHDSFKSECINTSNIKSESTDSVQTCVKITSSKIHQVAKLNDKITVRSKLAPPVPVKPKIVTNIPTRTQIPSKSTLNIKHAEQKHSNQGKNDTGLKHKVNTQQPENPDSKSDYNISEDKTKQPEDPNDTVHKETKPTEATNSKIKAPSNNIQLKRMSFERASLDSITRKAKNADSKRTSTEIPKFVTKSVLERRLEIESLSKVHPKVSPTSKSYIAKPRIVSRTISADSKQSSNIEKVNASTVSSINPNESTKTENEDQKASWVKQVVNKFQ